MTKINYYTEEAILISILVFIISLLIVIIRGLFFTSEYKDVPDEMLLWREEKDWIDD